MDECNGPEGRSGSGPPEGDELPRWVRRLFGKERLAGNSEGHFHPYRALAGAASLAVAAVCLGGVVCARWDQFATLMSGSAVLTRLVFCFGSCLVGFSALCLKRVRFKHAKPSFPVAYVTYYPLVFVAGASGTVAVLSRVGLGEGGLFYCGAFPICFAIGYLVDHWADVVLGKQG